MRYRLRLSVPIIAIKLRDKPCAYLFLTQPYANALCLSGGMGVLAWVFRHLCIQLSLM